MKKAPCFEAEKLPEISVIIPVYNVEKYLRSCLDSVFNQTFADYEVICVNDGSTDTSLKILQAYQKKDSRMRVISQDNQGLSAARNAGVAAACGTYVYFLDSDDSIHPQTLACLYDLITKHEADMVVHQHKRVKQVPTVFEPVDSRFVPVRVTSDPLFLLGDKGRFPISVHACVKLYKKSLIADMAFIPGIYFEDFPYAACLMKKHPKTIVTRLPLYFYMENDQSITHANWTVKKLTDYTLGLNAVFDCYQHHPKELNYILKRLYPRIIKQAFNSIFRHVTDMAELVQILQVYQQFFIRLNERGWFSCKGHKFVRYWAYRRLMKTKDVSSVIPMMKRIFK